MSKDEIANPCNLRGEELFIHQAQDLDALRAALRPFDLGADDDLSIHVKHMLRMIDKRA